ncbi:MAG: hypothetical protein LBC52_04690 [Treponema sp.]|jgi:hypothetical protein|nr:hypothetical protein [Treponema sp.]
MIGRIRYLVALLAVLPVCLYAQSFGSVDNEKTDERKRFKRNGSSLIDNLYYRIKINAGDNIGYGYADSHDEDHGLRRRNGCQRRYRRRNKINNGTQSQYPNPFLLAGCD